MKKSIWIPGMLVLAMAMTGCASTGDLERVKAQEMMLDAKVDQALKDAEAAKTAADEAAKKADAATARAAAAANAAEEKSRLEAAKSDAAFQRSMRK